MCPYNVHRPKTAVSEIHVFDGDVVLQHNAFRAPGAPTLSQLQAKPQKVNHLFELYSNMHSGRPVISLGLCGLKEWRCGLEQ
jgi:hypothetical protein